MEKTDSERLKNSKRLAILGIGSGMMQDDAAGIVVTQNLRRKFGEGNCSFRIFTCHTAPENYTKNITDFRPDHVLMVDAADLNLAPGTIACLPPERITDFSLGTHKLSLNMIIEYLRETVNPEFTIIAIQIKSMEYNHKISKEVKTAIMKVTSFLVDILENKD